MKHRRLKHRFVHYIPRDLDPGVLYISIEFASAAHRCCCGCGEEVVTPLTPHDWQITFDGETISLWPSVGNWDYGCRSHYIIRRNRVIEAKPLTDKQIAGGRANDKAVKARFYAEGGRAQVNEIPEATPQEPSERGFLLRVKRWLFGRG
jgi:Family of unknown function (DUF6527)